MFPVLYDSARKRLPPTILLSRLTRQVRAVLPPRRPWPTPRDVPPYDVLNSARKPHIPGAAFLCAKQQEPLIAAPGTLADMPERRGALMATVL